MLELARNLLLWGLRSPTHNGEAHGVTQHQPRVVDARTYYLHLGRRVMCQAAGAGLNVMRMRAVNSIADALDMPMLKHLNDMENFFVMILVQQRIFMGVCNRLDETSKGHLFVTSLQCVLLATSFYICPKPTLVACSAASIIPMCSGCGFISGLRDSMYEIINFKKGDENAQNNL